MKYYLQKFNTSFKKVYDASIEFFIFGLISAFILLGSSKLMGFDFNYYQCLGVFIIMRTFFTMFLAPIREQKLKKEIEKEMVRKYEKHLVDNLMKEPSVQYYQDNWAKTRPHVLSFIEDWKEANK